MLRTGAKRLLEAALLASGAPALVRRRRAGRTVILAYHNIVPAGQAAAGERSLHLPQEQFGAHLDLLASTHHVVTLDEALQDRSVSDKPRVVITWDDAYRGTVTAGVLEVARRGLPATIFVCPGRLGGQTFWWDRLAEGAGGAVPPLMRRRALEKCAGDDAAVLARLGHGAAPEESIPSHARSADESEVAKAAATPGIAIGAHSWSHPNLDRISPGRLVEELVVTREWLDRFAGAIPWLAYPYGIESASVRQAAQAAGYRGGCLITGGWVAARPRDPFRLPRLHIPAGLSLQGFAIRMAGILA